MALIEGNPAKKLFTNLFTLRMRVQITLLIALPMVLLCGCMRKLPDTYYSAYRINLELERTTRGEWQMQVTNPLACPLRLSFNSQIDSIDQILQQHFPQVLKAFGSIEVILPGDIAKSDLERSLKGNSFWSHLRPVSPDTNVLYQYPFPRGRSYPITQAYNGVFSHSNAFSRYAIDFEMPVGDTICAARDGIVVGIIKDNEDWIHGPDKRYRNFANYLRLFHPDETYSDYVHLKQNGVLVSMGDTVRAGQAIAISGFTGWTTIPHLHFNTFKPAADGSMEGIPIRFEKMDGKDIRKGMKAEHD